MKGIIIMGYVMNVFVNKFDGNDRIRFVYKVQRGKNIPNEEVQLGRFYKECVRLTRDCNIYHSNFYIFKHQKRITTIGLFIRNLVLSGNKRPIMIPSYENKGKYEVSREYFCYTFKPGENWWSVSKKFCGIGHKYKELLRYNGASLNGEIPKIIKIPYTLVNADSRTILQEE